MKSKKERYIGKEVISKEGLIIGKIKDIHNDGEKNPKTILIKPLKDINFHLFKLNERGDLIIPYKSLTKVKNIFVFEDFTPVVKKA